MADSSRYPIQIFYSEEDGGFIAVAKDLPGCSAFGETPARAAAEIQDAIKAWQNAATAAGNPVPEPSRYTDEVNLPSGKILLRLPRTLHASLIECAKQEDVSLNQHLVSVLSVSVGMTLVGEARRIFASMEEAQRIMIAAQQRMQQHILATTQETHGFWGSMRVLTPGARPSLVGSEAVSLSIDSGYLNVGRDQTENIVRSGEELDVGRLTAGLPVLVEGAEHG